MVAEIIEQKKTEIAALCRKYGVRSLWVFGSAATGAFNPDTSDVDFLVDLGEYDAHVHRRYFGLCAALEDLLNRSVDIVTVRSIENPYFREELEETRVLVYGPRGSEAAA
jgi:predicted nucleotidyltransferase